MLETFLKLEKIFCKDHFMMHIKSPLQAPKKKTYIKCILCSECLVFDFASKYKYTVTKDGLYAGYCGAIPIPGFWYWYSICGSQKSSISNTRTIPKFYRQHSNQKQRNTTQNILSITYGTLAAGWTIIAGMSLYVRAHFSSDFNTDKSPWSQMVLILIIYIIKAISSLKMVIPAYQTWDLFQFFLTFSEAFFT
jgi:hypothetical protein